MTTWLTLGENLFRPPLSIFVAKATVIGKIYRRSLNKDYAHGFYFNAGKMQVIDRIIHTLNLTSSDAREETIKSIVESTLYSYGEKIVLADLLSLIQSEYEISLFEHEVKECLSELEDAGAIINSNQAYILSPRRREEILAIELHIKEEKNRRQDKLRAMISQLSEDRLTDQEMDGLIAVFTEYLYECFLQYGRKAISIFTSTETDKSIKNQSEIVQSFAHKLDTKNRRIFKDLLEEFPKRLGSKDLEYLQSLAKKAECFFSLGLEKRLHDEIINLKIVDWIVFLDTNFLYSLMGLHKHAENYACLQLIKVVNEHKLQIKFTFIPDTQQELLRKRQDFEKNILKTNYTPSQLRALLKSEKLDMFSRSYFESKLTNPEGTSHPSEIVDNHIEILKQKKIQVYQSKFKRLREDSNYISDQIARFREYERFINEVRVDRGLDPKTPKEDHLLEHDVFLREAILSLRDHRATSLNEIKYFGLTLDRSLLGFDKQQVRQSSNPLKVPTFFLPSVLLGKLSKFLPLVTDDYRRAFVTAISSIALEDSNKKISLIAQQSVAKFHNMGIQDEGLILSCISRKVFLSDFERRQEDGDLDSFIESELNLQVEKMREEKERLEEEMIKVQNEARQAAQEKATMNTEVGSLRTRVEDLKGTLKVYERGIQKIKEAARKEAKSPAEQLDIQFENVGNDSASRDIVINVSQVGRILATGISRIFRLSRFLNLLLAINIVLILLIVITGIKVSFDSPSYINIPILTISLLGLGIRKVSEKLDDKLNVTFFETYGTQLVNIAVLGILIYFILHEAGHFKAVWGVHW